MDIVLGVSMAPSTVRMVLMEGESADGVTVDHDDFEVGAGGQSAPQRVVSAILGTREGAREGGYQLSSTGVSWSDPAEEAALREALVGHKVENVMLVSAFLAAAALAQAVGSATHYARTALLFVEPEAATLAVVSSDDGSITEVRRQPLSRDDTRAVDELTAMVAGAQELESHPDGLFVVGSGGVNVAMIKPELDKASPLPVSAPEEPEMALARGAALASAHAPLFASSTRALAWAQDPGTGAVNPALVSAGYAYVAPAVADYNATAANEPLAYSAVPDFAESGFLPALGPDVDDPELVDSRLLDFSTAAQPQRERKPMLVTAGVAALFVVGVVTLAIALAVGMRPATDQRPAVRANVVTHQAPPPKAVVPPPPAPPPPAEPVPVQAPAPAPQAPVHLPAAPAPPPPPPAAPPPMIPNLQIPGLPGGPPLFGPPRGGWGGHDDDDWGHGGGGHGGGHGRGGGHGGGGFPLPIPGLHF
ncbi:MAG: hypothetical protein ABI253_14940 [Mycobacterium sp.]